MPHITVLHEESAANIAIQNGASMQQLQLPYPAALLPMNTLLHAA